MLRSLLPFSLLLLTTGCGDAPAAAANAGTTNKLNDMKSGERCGAMIISVVTWGFFQIRRPSAVV